MMLKHAMAWTFFCLFLPLVCLASSFSATPDPAGENVTGSYRLTQNAANNASFCLKAENADVQAILRDLSKLTGIPIDVDPALAATVTTALHEASPEKIIKTLAENRGIVYVHSQGNAAGRQRIERVTIARRQTKKFDPIVPKAPPSAPPEENSHSGIRPPAVPQHLLQPSADRQPDKNNTAGRFRADELAVKFDEKLSREEIQSIVHHAGLSVKQYIKAINYYILAVPPNLSIDRVMQQMKNKGVGIVEPNYLIPVAFVPDDTHFPEQWALNNTGQTGGRAGADIDALEAWALGPAVNPVTVAFVDTGIDYMHDDLSGNLWQNPGEIPGNAFDDDGNGYVDDSLGWNFVDDNNDVMDQSGHGTQVAGIAGAITNNGEGISGLARNCRMMALRVAYSTPSGDVVLESVLAANAIVYAADNGASILNLSWGDTVRSSIIADAVSYAAEKGLLIIAAAGNANSDTFLYPAALDNGSVIAVGATDAFDEKAAFSNYGTWVDISAPGVSIYTTDRDNRYTHISGTSMATAYVSGLAAKIRGHSPDISATAVKSRILQSVDRLASLEGKNAAAGRINAHRAIAGDFADPYILSVSPGYAHAGDVIIISGDRFGGMQQDGRVIFSPNTPGTVISWSDTEIVCVVPAEAQTGVVTVVSGPDAGPETASNAKAFVVLTKYYDEFAVSHEFAGKGTAMGWRADDRSWQYALPFEFPFYGRKYQSVYVCSNGFLDFSDPNASYQNDIRNMKNRTMIAPFWADLTTEGNGNPDLDIYIHSPAADTICIRWKARENDTGIVVNTEVVLRQDGTITFHYGAGNTGLAPTVGISAGTGEAMMVAFHDGQPDLSQAQSLVFAPLAVFPPASFSISLNAGWNLISLPVLPENTTIEAVTEALGVVLESVWSYENGAWRIYSPQHSDVSDLDAVKPGRGYWINVTQAGRGIEIEGTINVDLPDLVAGWNLVGWGGLQPLPVAGALAAIGADGGRVWGYDDGQWRFFDSRYHGLSDLAEIEPGKGYWVKP